LGFDEIAKDFDLGLPIQLLAGLEVHAITVSFEALVHHPDEILPQLADFLGVSDKLPAMRACIDPALHRALKTGSPLKNN
jgi:hypothetical protein